MTVIISLAAIIRGLFRPKLDLALENMVLRQQLGILKDKKLRPKLRASDRLFWILLHRLWARWRDALTIVRLRP